VVAALQSPQPPSTEAMLTALLNDFTALPDPFLLVLDDYHNSAAPAVDQVLTFLLEHLPPQLHLVVATREDPHLPLARLQCGSYGVQYHGAPATLPVGSRSPHHRLPDQHTLGGHLYDLFKVVNRRLSLLVVFFLLVT
jgi:hypothetical protein